MADPTFVPAKLVPAQGGANRKGQQRSWLGWSLLFLVASLVGVASGLFGVGGGVLLIPLLALLFGFEQHRAQGTSLVALVPPTGLFAFLNYARAGEVSWLAGLLIMPGVFCGGILGGRIAQRLSPYRMRRVFAGLLFALGTWQIVSSWIMRR
jgi:uncharacterized protein